MIHLSPSNLNSYEQLDEQMRNPGSYPWQTPAKFKQDFLGLGVFSEKADAGNAVHDAALGTLETCPIACDPANPLDAKCHVCNGTGYTVTCETCKGVGFVEESPKGDTPSGNCQECEGEGIHAPTWFVYPEVIEAVRSHLKAPLADSVAESSFLLTGKEFGIDQFDLRISGRLDLLSWNPKIVHELKTTSNPLNLKKHEDGPQVLAYLVKFGLPVVLIGAEIKIKKRGRLGRKGDVALVHHEEKVCQPHPGDKARLKDIVLRCANYVLADPEMRQRTLNREPPELL